MTSCHRGLTREEECSSHKHVEWDVEFASLPKHHDTVSSPAFEVQDQRYRLQLRGDMNSVELNIFCMDLPVKGRVRCFVGLKRADGSYYHEIRTKVFEQDIHLICIHTFRIRLLERRFRTPNGNLTFFVQMNVESMQESVQTCSVEMNPSGDGHIREEDCSDHKHVEWDVDYTLLPDDDYALSSPVFRIKTQRYLLDLHATDSTVRLRLFNTGPPSNHPVKCFVGVKRGDGHYHHIIMSANVDEKKNFELWAPKLLHDFSKLTIEKQHLSPDDKLTFFLRICKEQTHLGSEMCSYGAIQMSTPGDGNTGDKDCNCFKHVDWVVNYGLQPENGNTLSSSAIEVGAQRYLLDLLCGPSVALRLFRSGPTSKRPVRCLMGVRPVNGCLEHSIDSPKLDLKKDYELWTLEWTKNFDRVSFELSYRDPNFNVSIFFLISEERKPFETLACSYCAAEMDLDGEGRIREEQCSGHKHVEWDVKYSSIRQNECRLWSPAFHIEDQRYLLELIIHRSHASVSVYRWGPSSKSYERYFLGVKLGGGSYHHDISSGKLDLEKKCLIWELQRKRNFSFMTSDIERCYLSLTGLVTFFFRTIAQYAQEGKKTCCHAAVEMSLIGEGRIREEECSGHKHMEWEFDYKSLPHDYKDTLVSPVFQVESQRYLIEISSIQYPVLRFYRTGPSSNHPVPCFVGFKFADGSYPHRITSYLLRHGEGSEMWKCMKVCSYIDKSKLKRLHLAPDGRMTFFVRVNIKRTQAETKLCSHGVADISFRLNGIISEKVWNSYKQVEWSFNFELSQGEVTSPVFSIADQNYLWELSCNEKHPPKLNLFRMGPSAHKFVRWWSVMRSANASYLQYATKCGQLNLEDEMCSMWKPVGESFCLKYLDGGISLVVGFLMSLERTQTKFNESILADDHSLQDLNPMSREDIVFNVKDEEYKIHKAVLTFRVPAFKAMLSHNFIESQTGVVHVHDCEPAAFREFLDFVYTGNASVLTLENCFALYSICEKYMMDEIKSYCFSQIKRVTVSLDNFFDAVKCALLHEFHDVLLKAADVLSKNQDIKNTEAWRDFYENNPKYAEDFLILERTFAALE